MVLPDLTTLQSNLGERFSLINQIEGSGLDACNDIGEPHLFSVSPYYNNYEFMNFLTEKLNSFIVYSLNCQSLNAKYDTLKIHIDNYNSLHDCEISAICLQETWLTEESDLRLLQLEGYNLIHLGKSCSAHSGLVIYLNKNYQYEIMMVKNNSEVWDGLFIKISISQNLVQQKSIILGNLYRPPRTSAQNINTFVNELDECLEVLSPYGNVYLTGDFNLDLLNFKRNNNINLFFEYMISNNYFPLITQPTRLNERGGTLIDNIFVKQSSNYSTLSSGIIMTKISDHQPYFVAIDQLRHNQPKFKYIKVVSSDSTSYANFKEELNSIYITEKLNQAQSSTANESYNNFHEIISVLISKHFKIKLVKFRKYRHKKSKWMTEGILRSVKFKDNLYVNLKATTTDDPTYQAKLTNFKTYSKILKQSIKLAKKNYFDNCFSKYKSDIKNTWSTINNILNKKNSGQDFPSHFDICGVNVSNDLIICNEFNKYFVNIGPQLADKIRQIKGRSFKDYLKKPSKTNFRFQPVTPDTIIKVIDSLKPKTSQGFDRISNKLLKFIKSEVSGPLSNIFNQCVHEGSFPILLKKAKIIPVYKQNEKSLFTNYRPISILSSVSKVFERIIYNQLYEYLARSKIFYKGQCGFRKHHSTEHATLELVDRVTKAMDKNQLPLNIYLDLSKAFDTLDHGILSYKLDYYGIKGQSLELLNDYLSNRTQQVVYNDTISHPLTLKCGVPQGSILGPLLFIIYMNDIVKASTYFYPILYADDTTLCATLNFSWKKKCNRKINNKLTAIGNWLRLNKLSLNVNKTKAMLFFTSQRSINYPNLFLYNKKIDFVKNFKFLGIVLHENLKWKAHTNMISKKISKTLGIMKKLKRTIPSNALLNIYNALIAPHLNYGIIIWGRESNDLWKLQKAAVRTITNSRYNAHANPLFVKLKILNLDDLCALHELKFCYKYENNLLPEYFKKHMLPRNSRITSDVTRQYNTFRLSSVRHEFAKRSIYFRFPKVFNDMDDSIKEKMYTHSIDGFKNYVKKIFLNSYDINCITENCPSC